MCQERECSNRLGEVFCSVVVPVYNCEDCLKECIESVIAQTYSNFELILVDDGSTDTSGLICDRYAEKDERIRVFHKENGGVSSARNFGIEKRRGNYVAFVDSDDYVHKDYLKRLVESAVEYKADLVCCDLNRGETADWSQSEKATIIRENDDILKRMYINDGQITIVVNKLFANHFFDEEGLRFTEGTCYEDILIMPYFLRNAKKMVIISDNLYFYRQRKGSITKIGSFSKKRLDLISVIEKRLVLLKEWEEENLFYIELEGYLRKLIRYRAKMDKYNYKEQDVIKEIEDKLFKTWRKYLFDFRLGIKIKIKAAIAIVKNRMKRRNGS